MLHLFVASELVSDVEEFVPEHTHVASTNNKLGGIQRGILVKVCSVITTFEEMDHRGNSHTKIRP